MPMATRTVLSQKLLTPHDPLMRQLILLTLCSSMLASCSQGDSSLTDWSPLANKSKVSATTPTGPVIRASSAESQPPQCVEELAFTELKASPAGKSISLEVTSTPEEATAIPLAAHAEMWNVAMFPPASIEPDLGTSGFIAVRAAPTDAWKLVAERVREGSGKKPYLYRAAIFDDKGAEMGRWQGHRLVPDRECQASKNAALWDYLKLPTDKVAGGYSSLRDAITGTVEVRALAPTERLTAAPDSPITANDGCSASFTDNPKRLVGHMYLVRSGSNQMAMRLQNNYPSERNVVAFVCDTTGVTAVSALGARRFRWDGTPDRDWKYGIMEGMSGPPLFPTFIHHDGADTVVDFRKVEKDIGWRVTLPASKNTTATKPADGETLATPVR